MVDEPQTTNILKFPVTRQMELRIAERILDRFTNKWNEKIDAEIAEVHAAADGEVNRHGGLHGYGLYMMRMSTPAYKSPARAP